MSSRSSCFGLCCVGGGWGCGESTQRAEWLARESRHRARQERWQIDVSIGPFGCCPLRESAHAHKHTDSHTHAHAHTAWLFGLDAIRIVLNSLECCVGAYFVRGCLFCMCRRASDFAVSLCSCRCVRVLCAWRAAKTWSEYIRWSK